MPLIHALGTCVHVDLGEDIDEEEFGSAWSRCLAPTHGLRSKDGDDAPTVTARGSMTSLTQSITRALIEQRAGELLMLHAGAVSHPDTGASIAYVAPGGTGKTTLSRLLGSRYGYLTDETVGIVPRTWEIEPYPKPLSTRTTSGGYPKSELSPDDLGLMRAHPAPRLTVLALLRRTPGRDEAGITRMDLFDAIIDLMPETSSLAALDEPLHLLAQLYEELGGVWLLEFGDSEQLIPWIDAQLGAA